MSFGPGKYDPECTHVRQSTNAEAVLVIVIGGDRGEGFSVQATNPLIMPRIPTLLRTVANEIDATLESFPFDQPEAVK